MGCSIRLDFQNLEEEDAHHEVSEPDVFLRGKLPAAARIGRHADSSDLATLKLALSSETPFLSLGRLSHATVEARCARDLIDCEEARRGIFLYDVGGQAVGYVDARPVAGICAATLGSFELGVVSAWSGQGIGRSLVAAAEEWLLGTGRQLVAINVAPGNVQAQRFHRKLGYALADPSSPEPFRHDGPVNEIVMTKRLDLIERPCRKQL